MERISETSSAEESGELCSGDWRDDLEGWLSRLRIGTSATDESGVANLFSECKYDKKLSWVTCAYIYIYILKKVKAYTYFYLFFKKYGVCENRVQIRVIYQ